MKWFNVAFRMLKKLLAFLARNQWRTPIEVETKFGVFRSFREINFRGEVKEDVVWSLNPKVPIPGDHKGRSVGMLVDGPLSGPSEDDIAPMFLVIEKIKSAGLQILDGVKAEMFEDACRWVALRDDDIERLKRGELIERKELNGISPDFLIESLDIGSLELGATEMWSYYEMPECDCCLIAYFDACSICFHIGFLRGDTVAACYDENYH